MTTPKIERTFAPHCAILAWVWPGLGHIVHGERRRGVLIMAGVLFLFVGGLLIGGLDCVDRRNDRLWFMAQSFCGPIAFAADFARDAFLPPINRAWTSDAALRGSYVNGDPDTLAQLQRPSLAHVNEIGTLYIALAGLMNLAVIIDALYFARYPQPDRRRPQPEAAG